MSNLNAIPEADFAADGKAAPQQRKTRSKKGHETRVNAGIYIILILMSLIWLIPFIFLVFQSFRSYQPGVDPQAGGMAPYVLPTTWSLDSYAYLFEGSDFFPWMGKSLIAVLLCGLAAAAFFIWLRKIEKGGRMIPARIAGALLGPVLLAVWGLAAGETQAAGRVPEILIGGLLCAAAVWIFAGIYLKNDLFLAKLPGMQQETSFDRAKKALALFGEICV